MQANPRFSTEYEITIGPTDDYPVDVGPVFLNEDDDTIWIEVTSAPSGDCPWPWSYGLLTWITENGRELGTVKINGVCEGEVFRLGVGRPPSVRSGRLSFTPRNYNLAWVKLGHPWTLTFRTESGYSGGVQLPAFGTKATLMVPAVPSGNSQPDFSIEGEFARLLLNLFVKR